MGVWIEIIQMRKQHIIRFVTPFMGVWIEIGSVQSAVITVRVTPFMGVWIEIFIQEQRESRERSHPLWVCGLKYLCLAVIRVHLRHTLYGCVD